jgi:hypothetical protein
MMILKTSRSNLSSNDQLSLDLPFAATKSLTARVGPTPTFTRSSGDNRGTTYFGPLVDFTEATAFSTTGISNGRASWFKSYEGIDITISYTGTRWRAAYADNGNEVIYLAAPGGEWRPDQADWSGEAISVTTSSSFGIVKAANNEPRFDHDPVTGVCRGLLIEEGRTNLTSRSEEFNETAWLKLRSSISANSTASPSGDNSADKLIEDSSAGTHMTYRTLNTVSLVAHTFSVFAKADGRNFVYLNCGDGFPLNSHAYFNLSNGTLGTIGANATASITAFGNGWYRCSVTATPTSTTTNGFYIQTASANGAISYQGDGTSGIFIWGAQVEAGSFATSYIPTTTGTLARSADVCSIANTSSFWNSDQFTLFGNANIQNLSHNAFPANFVISGGLLGIRRSQFNFALAAFQASGVFADINFGSFTASSMRMALAHSSGQQAAALNGATAVQQSSAFSPPLNPALNIGYSGVASTYINGHIAAIRYYKKRLPNAKLQALTV